MFVSVHREGRREHLISNQNLRLIIGGEELTRYVPRSESLTTHSSSHRSKSEGSVRGFESRGI